MQIKTAILSFGMSGRVFHAPFIHLHPGFTFYAVLERSKNLAAELYPDVITYRTIEELVADPAIELVIVNTPNKTHYEYAKMALQAGKHVVVEKPFTVTVEQGEELISLAKSRNVKLSGYHNRRFDSDYKTVKGVLDKKLLGDIVEAEIHYDRFKQELSPKVHKETPGPGTGALYDLGSHLIDQALQLFGMPDELFADIQTLRPESQVDDYFELLFYYPKMRVRLKSGYIIREALPGYVVHGYKGSFIKPRTDNQETRLQAGELPNQPDWGIEPEAERGLLHTEVDGKVIREKIPSDTGNYMDYYEGVFQAIRKNAPVPVSAEDAVNVIRIIESAFESNNVKCVTKIR